LLCVQSVALADLKITTKDNGGASHTTYFKGKRQRTEDPQLTIIQQCDLRRMIQINDRAHKYVITPLDENGQPDASGPSEAPQGAQPTRRGAVVTVTASVVDTGERQQMFGYTARHIKSKNVTDAPPGACDPGHTESETDGWYIDLPVTFGCDVERAPAPPRRARPGCQDRYVTKVTGTGKLGFPVKTTTTYKNGEGDESAGGAFTNTVEVTDISTVTLDPSLFEIPAGYQQAASMMDLMMPSDMPGAAGMNGIPGMPSGAMPPAGEAGESTGAGVPSAGVPGAASSVGPKQPGTIRVGVAAINNKAGGSISLDELRSRLVGAIGGSGVEAVPLDADSAPAAEAEAKRKDCDLVLYTDLSALKQSAASKIGGMFGRAAGVGGGDRYESRVDFRLFAVGGASQLESSATAKEEGADASVGSALDKEAKAVASAARKKK
jgi:hypothetical protein